MALSTVVILNYNGRDFLLRFLPILIRFTPQADIVVADNASSDDSLSVLAKFPEIRILPLEQNFGYAGGYNEALKQLDSPYYVLLNSDVEVSENWLAPLESFLNQNSAYAAAQPKLLDYKNREYFEYAGAAGGYIDWLGYPYCKGRIFQSIEKDTGQYNSISDIFWSSGACFIIRSKLYHEAGGFDADFFAHMEEIDLCWRLKSHGHKVACVPESVVFHVGGGTLDKVNPHKTYLNFRNNLALLIKNLSLPNLVIVLPIRFLLDFTAGIKFMITNSPGHFLAVLKAQKDTIIRFGKAYQKRSLTSGTHSGPEKKTSVVWEYFIRGYKTFHEINNTR